MKDRRRAKVTDSPAPFRCTSGEYYGPAAFLIHKMTLVVSILDSPLSSLMINDIYI